MIEFVYENSKYMIQMARHIGDRSTCELLPLFLCYESHHYENKNPKYLEVKLKVVDEILNIISKAAHDFEV
jgi:hypothetical protein